MATFTEQPDPAIQNLNADAGTITLPAGGSIKKIINPSNNRSGMILTAGTIDGQELYLLNNTGFTVTFDVVSTSNVANGTSCVIAAHAGVYFTWGAGLTVPAWVCTGKG